MELKHIVYAAIGIAFFIAVRLGAKHIASIDTEPTTSDNTTFDEADIYHQ